MEEIRSLENQYKKLEELYAIKLIPDYRKIEESIESLKISKYHKKYPDLTSKYPWLGRYCGKNVYMFSVKNFPYNKSEIKKKFEEISTISLCRINDSKEWEKVQSNEAVCLYIGSTEHIRQRLNEHLFLCSPNKTAMHLEKWFEPNVTITITMRGFNDFIDSKNSDYLEKIEAILRKHYQPLFGRQGKKSYAER